MYDDVVSRGFAITHVKDYIAKVETASGIVERFLFAAGWSSRWYEEWKIVDRQKETQEHGQE